MTAPLGAAALRALLAEALRAEADARRLRFHGPIPPEPFTDVEDMADALLSREPLAGLVRVADAAGEILYGLNRLGYGADPAVLALRDALAAVGKEPTDG